MWLHYNASFFQGFTETILTPLQASTILFKANQKRAALNPPIPPITREQILNGDLTELLEESDYDLTYMVNSKFCTNYPTDYLFIHLLWSWFTKTSSNKPLSSQLSAKLLVSLSIFLCGFNMHPSVSCTKHIMLTCVHTSNLLEYACYFLLFYYILKVLVIHVLHFFSVGLISRNKSSSYPGLLAGFNPWCR